METNVLIWVAAAVAGYLIGSISFSRIIYAWQRPGESFPEMTVEIPGTEAVFRSNSSGATTIFDALGPKWGGITAVFDILKAVLPTLLMRLMYPDQLLFLLVGFFTIVGHIYPVYYGFRGGRGSSTISGVLLVLDWFGTLLTAVLGLVVGVLGGWVNTARWLGRIFMIPYVWFVYQEPWYVVFTVAANLLFFLSMRGEIRQLAALKRQGALPDQETIAELTGVGSLYRLSQKISIPALLNSSRRNDGEPSQRKDTNAESSDDIISG